MTAQTIWADLLGDSTLSDTMTASGISIDEDKALNYSAFWCGVNMIATQIASLPLEVYRRITGGKEKATDHSNYDILHGRPSSESGKQNFWESRVGQEVSWGNGYAEIDRTRDGQTVGELQPVRADRVTPMRVADKDVGRPLIGFDGRTRAAQKGMLVYVITDSHGSETLFHHMRIFHIAGFGFDGVQGYSVVRRAKETIGGGLAGDMHYNKILGSRAIPAGILTLGAPLKGQKKEKLKKDWDAQFGNISGRQGIAVLEGDGKFHQLLMSPADQQLLESRRFSIEEVARWLLMPVSKLRDITNSKTRSNMEEEGRSFVTDTLRPHAKRIEEECNYKLFTKEERKVYFVEFNFDGLLSGDTKARSESHSKAVGGPWLTQNEVRAIENKNPVPGGDNVLVPLNMATMDNDGMIIVPDKGDDKDGDSKDAGDKSKGVNGKKPAAEKRSRAAAVETAVARQVGDPVVDQVEKAADDFGVQIDLLSPLLGNARERVHRKEQARIKQGRKRLETKGEQAFLEWAAEFYDDHASFVVEAVAPVFQSAMARLRLSAGLAASDDESLAFVAAYCDKYAADHVLRGKQNCARPDFLARFDGNVPYNVTTVEICRFLNAATVAVYKKVDGAQIHWVTNGCTPECAALKGAQVSPGEEFTECDGRTIGHPPLNSSCRWCIVVGVKP